MKKETSCGTFEMSDLMYDILNNIPESIMILDREFKIVYANETLLKTAGLAKGEVVGDHCYKITHGLDDVCAPPDHKCPIAEFQESGKSETFIHKHKDAEGKEFYTEVAAYPIKDEQGDIVGFMHMSRNLSDGIIRAVQDLKKLDCAQLGEKKEIQELKKKLREAGE